MMKLFGLLAFSLLAGAPASAATIVQTLTIASPNGNFVQQAPSTLQRFDASLGTLTGVTIDASSVGRRGERYNTMIRPSDPARAYSFTATLSGSSFIQLGGNAGGTPQLLLPYSGSASGSGFGPTRQDSFSYFVDGNFSATCTDTGCGVPLSGYVFGPANPNFPKFFNVSINPDARFTVTGSLPQDLSAGPFKFGSETYTLKLTYTYDDAAAAVPEAGTWAMMILGFGLVGGLARRRKTAGLALSN